MINIDSPIYQNPPKKQVDVRLICLVKAGINLRPLRLNQIDIIYLHRPSPWPRQALERFGQATQGQRFPADLIAMNFRDLLANQAQGAEGKLRKKAKQARRIRPKILHELPFGKNDECRAELNFNNEQAAFGYQENFRSNEPPRKFANELSSDHFLKKTRASHYLTN